MSRFLQEKKKVVEEEVKKKKWLRSLPLSLKFEGTGFILQVHINLDFVCIIIQYLEAIQ